MVTKMIKKILMAMDGSKTSDRALKVAIEMAMKMEANITLVGVIDNRLYTGKAMLASDSPNEFARARGRLPDASHRRHLPMSPACAGRAGLEPEIVIRTGHPADRS